MAGGPATLQAIERRLTEIDPLLAARGRSWLEAQLARSSRVTRSSGGRYELKEMDRTASVAEPESERDSAGQRYEELSHRYVVFDLEANADRAFVGEHEIIEIGACLVEDGRVAATFESLVKACRPLTKEVSDLTGITEEDLADAPDWRDALGEFLEFVNDLPLVAHNGFSYDFVLLNSSLEAAGLPLPTGARLDSLDFAHVVYPRTGDLVIRSTDGSSPPLDRSLGTLAGELGVSLDEEHRALSDARTTASVVMAMVERLNADTPVHRLQRWLLAWSENPWGVFCSPTNAPPSLEDVIPAAPKWGRPEENEGKAALAKAVAPLRRRGALMRDGREPRPSQVEMARLVIEAFQGGRQQVIEAPTGTGKTLAYLLPAVSHVRASGGPPVVISTHSKVLQDQVLSAARELDPVFRDVQVSVLKGRDNYIDVESLQDAVEDPQADADQALGLAALVGWAALTPTGEWDDLRFWMLEQRAPDLPALRWRLRVKDEPGVAGSDLAERCFYRRALDRAEKADVVVLNHALLVSQIDGAVGGGCLVVDEGHNLEEAVTNALTESMDESSIVRLLNAVHDRGRRWGTVGRYLDATGGSVGDEMPAAVFSAHEDVWDALHTLREPLTTYVRERSGARREDAETYGTAYRVRQGFDTRRPEYLVVDSVLARLATSLHELGKAIGELPVPEKLRRRYRRRRLEAEIRRMSRECIDASRVLAEFRACAREPQWIYVVRLEVQAVGWTWELQVVPVSVAEWLEALWGEVDGLAITSAILQVGGSFHHLTERLGLTRAEPKALDTPFASLGENELLVLPGHLPTPTGGLLDEFSKREREEIARLFALAGGRAMALFTSRARMMAACEHVRPQLERFQVPVLMQGEEPSPALVERMRSDVPASLLATRIFWEGVDIPGEALSLLVIEKVPFDPPDDPIVAARMDEIERRGRDPFAEYLVPQAALRFAQGVGRLIRTKDDTGVVVLLDKRLRRPVSYRDDFLKSLQGPPRVSRPRSVKEGYERIAAHLDVSFDDDLWRRLRSLGLEDPVWGRLEELQLSPEDILDVGLVRERLEAVREMFGFADWRPGQLEVMERFIQGEDLLAVLPTGSGKSLTYQIPALLSPGLTLVVSPLIALMRDQIKNQQERGLTHINGIYSGQSQAEQEDILAGARRGRYKLLYVSPERLWSKKFRTSLAGVCVDRVAIDEAHCVSQWGHSFRPEYGMIATAVEEIAKEQNRPPLLALTATVTEKVRKDIVEILGLQLDGSPVLRSPDRSELHYYVERCINFDDRDLHVLRIAEAYKAEKGIIYVPRRKDAERLAEYLRADNHVAQPYHGGMEPGRRIHIEEAFRDGEIDVVVATKAFGLGIDKPDISYVLHVEMPGSVEEYIQETGRAARGAMVGLGPERGACILLSTPRDCQIHKYFIRGAAPSLEDVRSIWKVIERGEKYYLPEDLSGAAGFEDESGERVALAVHYLIKDGALRRYEDVTMAGRVWLPSDLDEALDELGRRKPELAQRARPPVVAVDRLDTEEYDARTWSRAAGLEPPELESLLLELAEEEIVGFSTWMPGLHLEPVVGSRPDWNSIAERCEERLRIVEEQSERAKDYRSQDAACRRKWLMDYLSFDAEELCDGCDVCRPELPRPWVGIEKKREHLETALPTRAVCMALLSDVSGMAYSVNSLIRALLGEEGRYPSQPFLRDHGTFGRLSGVGFAAVQAEFDRMVAEGLAEYEDAEYQGSEYQTIRLTEQAPVSR